MFVCFINVMITRSGGLALFISFFYMFSAENSMCELFHRDSELKHENRELDSPLCSSFLLNDRFKEGEGEAGN